MKTFHFKTRSKTVLGDLHTPVSTYLKLRDLFPQSALMESSDYHGAENNRSFIGLNPIASFAVGHNEVTFSFPDHSVETNYISDSYKVEDALTEFLTRFNVTGDYNHYFGLYGYTSSNSVRYFEHIDIKDSTEKINDAPDMLYILYKYIIVFNDFSNAVIISRLGIIATFL